MIQSLRLVRLVRLPRYRALAGWLAGRASRIDGGSESCGIKCNNQTRGLRVDSTCAGQYANQEAQRPNGQCQTQIAQRGVRRRVLSVRLTRLFLQRLPLA